MNRRSFLRVLSSLFVGGILVKHLPGIIKFAQLEDWNTLTLIFSPSTGRNIGTYLNGIRIPEIDSPVKYYPERKTVEARDPRSGEMFGGFFVGDTETISKIECQLKFN